MLGRQARPVGFTLSGYFCITVEPGCCSDVFPGSWVLTYTLLNFGQEESRRRSLHVMGEKRRRLMRKEQKEIQNQRPSVAVKLCCCVDDGILLGLGCIYRGT